MPRILKYKFFKIEILLKHHFSLLNFLLKLKKPSINEKKFEIITIINNFIINSQFLRYYFLIFTYFYNS